MFKKTIIGIVGRSDTSSEKYNVICCFESVRKCLIKKGAIPILILPNQDVEYEISKPSDIDRLTNEEKEEWRQHIVKVFYDRNLVMINYYLEEVEKLPF